MSNQRVVVLTDEQITASVDALAGSADNSIAAATAEAELTAALEHPEGITDEQVGDAINELSGHDAGSEQSWIEVRHALEAALFPGEDNE